MGKTLSTMSANAYKICSHDFRKIKNSFFWSFIIIDVYTIVIKTILKTVTKYRTTNLTVSHLERVTGIITQ